MDEDDEANIGDGEAEDMLPRLHRDERDRHGGGESKEIGDEDIGTRGALTKCGKRVKLLEAAAQRAHEEHHAEAERVEEGEVPLRLLHIHRPRRGGCGEGDLDADAHLQDGEGLEPKTQDPHESCDGVALHHVVNRVVGLRHVEGIGHTEADDEAEREGERGARRGRSAHR